MRYSFIKYAALTTVTAGITFAQVPEGEAQDAQRVAPSTQEAPNTPEASRSVTAHLEHMAQALNLTASQREQARMIFEHARQSAQPILPELRQNRMKLTAAAKANASESDIQKLADDQGRLLGQMVAIRTEASAKFYQLLTPEQRVKADQMREQARQRMRSRVRGGGL
jgi:Spy/CpxP family protein refolding chaperone